MEDKHKYMTRSDILGRMEEQINPKTDNFEEIYNKANDFSSLLGMSSPFGLGPASLETMDELMERDDQRNTDGFPKKIKVGKLPADNGKIILVPATEQEKLIHIPFDPDQQGGGSGSGGQGEGEEGDVIGEQPIDEESDGEGEDGEGQAGEGSGGEHGTETQAYDLGEKLLRDYDFQLPNMMEKSKKMPTTRYKYDMTDRHRGSGQVLDKKATMREIVKTNNALGRIDPNNIDTTNFIVSPQDLVYRVLSAEREFESQAIVFFLRDYSGSMSGNLTKAVVTQHLMIYALLMYHYQERVKTRFILHDTEAKEVPNFDIYYRSRIAGGTMVASAYKLLNKIVAEEQLAKDYNIYVFHGTDGDDWDTKGDKTIPEMEEMMTYVNRAGLTIVKSVYGGRRASEMENYMNSHDFLDTYSDNFKMDVIEDQNFEDARLVEGIKKLFS